jgi:hypothetical protein
VSSQPNDPSAVDPNAAEAVPIPEQVPAPSPESGSNLASDAPSGVNAAASQSDASIPANTTPYVPSPEVEALTPTSPEVLPPSATPSSVPSSSIGNTMVVVPAPPGAPEGVGGILLSPDAILGDPQMRGVIEDFAGQPQARPSSRDLFRPEADEPDASLLKSFVTNQRLRDLWHQIDALQEEVIQSVRADRSATDVYQQDLLYASSLLLQAPGSYDESRQIVYRVRGDLMRERKVEADIKRYRPALALYYVVWLVLVVLFAGADPKFRELMPDSLPILKLAYPPMLFAVLGALVNGLLALIKHTTTRRDFDPIYISWYMVNPLIGGLLGLVIFIFFVVTGTSFTPNLITDPNITQAQAPLAIWILAFIVGWQQNTAVQLLNGFLKTVSTSGGEAAQEGRPVGSDSTTPTTTTTPKTPPTAQG